MVNQPRGIGAILIGLAMLVGCSSHRLSAPVPAPETTVRVSFLVPRDVVARTPTGDSVVLADVRELNGSVLRAQLETPVDSLHVRLGSARTHSGGIGGIPKWAIVAVPRGPLVRVEQKTIGPAKTLKLVVTVVATAALLAGLYVAAAFQGS